MFEIDSFCFQWINVYFNAQFTEKKKGDLSSVLILLATVQSSMHHLPN